MSIAYHNLGVELEYLKRYDKAISSYEVKIFTYAESCQFCF